MLSILKIQRINSLKINTITFYAHRLGIAFLADYQASNFGL